MHSEARFNSMSITMDAVKQYCMDNAEEDSGHLSAVLSILSQQVGVVCLFVCLFVCLSVCLFVCLSVCLFVCLSVCLFVCLSVCLFVCLSVCLFVYCLLFIVYCLCLSVYRWNRWNRHTRLAPQPPIRQFRPHLCIYRRWPYSVHIYIPNAICVYMLELILFML